jgi:hypothetical protein
MLRPYRQGMRWRRHGVRTDITGRVRKLGWSTRLCIDEDSNDRGSIGISGSHPRRFEQRHERKEVWGNGRDPVQSVPPTP